MDDPLLLSNLYGHNWQELQVEATERKQSIW